MKAIVTHLATALVCIAGTSAYFLSRSDKLPNTAVADPATHTSELLWDDSRVRSDPAAFVYVEAGNAKLHAGDGAGAERDYRRAVAIDPQSASLRIVLAVGQQYSGKFDEALENFEKALALEPGNARGLAGIAGAAYRARDLPRAIELYEQALDRDPRFAGAHWGIAWAYRDKGEYRKAIGHLEQYLAIAQDKVKANDELAREQIHKMEDLLRKGGH